MAHSPEPSPVDRDATPLGATLPGGARVGGYLIERPIASGARGTVYRALDERLGRRVALKVVSESALPQARDRFLREVRVIAGLQHPNVVMFLGAGEDRGVAWAAMELMPASLSQELHQRGRFSPGGLRAIVRDVCLGLDAAWRRDILHRDIKPSNLLRSADGTVKVADFGLAKDLSPELNLAASDAVLGTPWYLSPEAAAGTPGGVTSDLYSLGATLYHLAAGRPPFDSANVLDVIVRHAIEPVAPLPDDVPPSMARLIMSLLEKNPVQRPGDYHAVLAALDGSDQVAGDRDSPGELTRTLLAAARAALQLGRGRRVRSLLEPIVNAHDEGWTRAGFLLATALEDSQAVNEAREILDDIVANASCHADRALAVWNLGRLREEESAVERAVEIYSGIKTISTPRFPMALLEARIARLRNLQRAPATPPA